MLQKKKTETNITEEKKRNNIIPRRRKRKENLDFIHTKTIFFPYVQIETEEERTYIEKRK